MSRIFFVHLYNNYSGSPRVLRNTIEAFSGHVDMTLICSEGDGFLSDSGCRKKLFWFKLFDNRLLGIVLYFWAQLAIFFLVFSNARRDDVVFVNTSVPVAAAIAGKLKGCRIIFHLHEDARSLNVIHRVAGRVRLWTSDLDIYVTRYL